MAFLFHMSKFWKVIYQMQSIPNTSGVRFYKEELVLKSKVNRLQNLHTYTWCSFFICQNSGKIYHQTLMNLCLIKAMQVDTELLLHQPIKKKLLITPRGNLEESEYSIQNFINRDLSS